MVIRWPLAFTQLEKSPFHISGVGTLWNEALLPCSLWNPSKDAKKNVRLVPL